MAPRSSPCSLPKNYLSPTATRALFSQSSSGVDTLMRPSQLAAGGPISVPERPRHEEDQPRHVGDESEHRHHDRDDRHRGAADPVDALAADRRDYVEANADGGSDRPDA